MRKMIVVLISVLMLAGCGSTQTLETIADEPVLAVSAEQREVKVELPDDAAVMTMSCDNKTIYLCGGYEICFEVLDAVDLDRTIKQVTGFHEEYLTVLKTGYEGFSKHEMVWSSAGETGDYLGRAVVLDDGDHHYCMTVMADEAGSGDLDTRWDALFASMALRY
jgi:hypothetical protein